MNPSRYRLPQHCSEDRKRARRATIALGQESYAFASDRAPGHSSPGFQLPPGVAGLPTREQFGPEKKVRLLKHKLFAKLQAPFVRIAMGGSRMDCEVDYERMVGWLPRPREADHWASNEDFARQRTRGVNPKALFRWSEPPAAETLLDASNRVLKELYGSRLNAAVDAGRLFGTDYSLLQDSRVQEQVRRDVTLAAPTCTFYVDDRGVLMPLAILLRPESEDECPVSTVLDPPGDWLLARTHAQCADAHYHEAVYHLLETHMVSEVFAVCTARELHPDHPVRQLIGPHFQWNLAVNHLARGDLLTVGGPIDKTFAAQVGGAMDLARAVWSDWCFERGGFHADMSTRGVDDEKLLPDYFYRKDGGEIFAALEAYVRRMIELWYEDDGDVVADYELQAWAKEIASIIPQGFPSRIRKTKQLISIVTEVIYRASAGHSAVNNGQFDAYGFAPNVPGSVAAPLPGSRSFEESDVLKALPGTKQCLLANAMAWTLSQPTHRSILTTGESPAFAKELNPRAYAAVDALRSRLRRISASIGERNSKLAIPYTYLDPKNVARSTGI